MAIKRKILLSACIVVFLFSLQPLESDADVVSTSENFVYLFHLYYDNGQLFADRDVKFKYDIIAEPYVTPILKTANPYYGQVLNFKNAVLATFKFDQSIVKGRVSVKGPYFADASSVNFYNDSNGLLLTIDVSGSSFCNDDEVCNSDVGENSDNCSNDCKLKPPPIASTTPIPNAGYPARKILLVILAVVIGGFVVLAIWLIIKKKRAANQIPPSLPPDATI